MNEITVFALALLAVPVFARFARVPAESRKIYHMIGLAGLLFLMGETTRIVSTKSAWWARSNRPSGLSPRFSRCWQW